MIEASATPSPPTPAHSRTGRAILEALTTTIGSPSGEAPSPAYALAFGHTLGELTVLITPSVTALLQYSPGKRLVVHNRQLRWHPGELRESRSYPAHPANPGPG
jgi:hypothetical protein